MLRVNMIEMSFKKLLNYVISQTTTTQNKYVEIGNDISNKRL